MANGSEYSEGLWVGQRVGFRRLGLERFLRGMVVLFSLSAALRIPGLNDLFVEYTDRWKGSFFTNGGDGAQKFRVHEGFTYTWAGAIQEWMIFVTIGFWTFS